MKCFLLYFANCTNCTNTIKRSMILKILFTFNINGILFKFTLININIVHTKILLNVFKKYIYLIQEVATYSHLSAVINSEKVLP